MINRLDVLTVLTIFLVAFVVPLAFFGVPLRAAAPWQLLLAALLVVSGCVLCVLDKIRMMAHDKR